MTTPPTTAPSLQQELSTLQGFKNRVKSANAFLTGAIALLLASLAGLAINTFQLGSASDWTWSLIGRYFFDAEAIEFTGYRASRAEFWRHIYVWGPVVLLPISIILFVLYFTTRASSLATLHAAYLERGWIGRQALPGLRVKNGRQTVDIALVSHPSIPDADFGAIISGYSQHLASLDKKAQNAASKAALKAGAVKGVSAAAFDPNLPAAITATSKRGNGEYAVVIPPAAGAKGKSKVLQLK